MQFLQTKPAGHGVAVFGFGKTAIQLTGFGRSPTDADQALCTLDVDGVVHVGLTEGQLLAYRRLDRRTAACDAGARRRVPSTR